MNDLATQLAVVAVIAVLLYFTWRRKQPRPRPKDAEERLLAVCLGDKALMERLIRFELQKYPGVPRAEAAERAIVSRRRDNR